MSATYRAAYWTPRGTPRRYQTQIALTLPKHSRLTDAELLSVARDAARALRLDDGRVIEIGPWLYSDAPLLLDAVVKLSKRVASLEAEALELARQAQTGGAR